MWNEFLHHLADWQTFDSWIVLAGALAAMACALPGTWLLLRRQSLLGDALSHAVLPGIVLAYLAMSWMETTVSSSGNSTRNDSAVSVLIQTFARQSVLFLGAAVSGIIAAALTDLIQRLGRMERSAALGVVFTSMFAVGLLFIRLFADQAHIDADCVLYGNLEATALGVSGVPRAVIVNGVMLIINGVLVALFFKELRLVAFDPELAGSLGLNSGMISIALMTVTAATIVAAFESVGAILVIAMLVVPAATARLLTDRLWLLLILGPVLAAMSAIFGHVFALTLPAMICSRVGWPQVESAGTAGMMAVMSGAMFLAAVVFSPKQGVIRSTIDRLQLRIRIASEDILGAMYRRDERRRSAQADPVHASVPVQVEEEILREQNWTAWFARRSLLKRGLINVTSSNDELTDLGRRFAQDLVRSHRLWESYMAKYFDLPEHHLHVMAERVEHYLDPLLQAELAAELDQPSIDPHGKSIPPVVQ